MAIWSPCCKAQPQQPLRHGACPAAATDAQAESCQRLHAQATRQAHYNNPIMKGTHTEVITVDPAIATPAKVPAKGFT